LLWQKCRTTGKGERDTDREKETERVSGNTGFYCMQQVEHVQQE